MDKITNSFTSIEQVAGQYLNNQPGKKIETTSDGLSFQDILKQRIDVAKPGQVDLKFSKHASQRLDDRDISLSDDQNQRLRDGVAKASEKGIKESLVIVDSLAFIVNVPNQTVVTAMDQADTTENVFTNIDGAVII
ncbi:MAG: flagellar protein [Lachnospiraceae bacterium]|jgi:flagellar operon protein|nr:flagellar protein [Lachnospiraceae bacterium]MBQ1604597.1 flagellar protein [Lachnospiraceae bacterium]MBQ4300596.1 flagellar protein [Lachnospiraceae bacterium]MBR1572777.1 flagellar protein [Lachnospiraceae bacterium]